MSHPPGSDPQRDCRISSAARQYCEQLQTGWPPKGKEPASAASPARRGGNKAWHGTERHDTTRHDTAGHGTAQQVTARQDTARHGALTHTTTHRTQDSPQTRPLPCTCSVAGCFAHGPHGIHQGYQDSRSSSSSSSRQQRVPSAGTGSCEAKCTGGLMAAPGPGPVPALGPGTRRGKITPHNHRFAPELLRLEPPPGRSLWRGKGRARAARLRPPPGPARPGPVLAGMRCLLPGAAVVAGWAGTGQSGRQV